MTRGCQRLRLVDEADEILRHYSVLVPIMPPMGRCRSAGTVCLPAGRPQHESFPLGSAAAQLEAVGLAVINFGE